MRFRPSPGTLIASIALFVALGGPAWAAKLIDGGNIRRGTVSGKQIKDASLSRTELTERAVTQLQRTPDNTIGSFQLKNGAVTGSKLALASVGGSAIADGTLTGADLAPQSISNGALAADSVGFTELADDSVGKANLRQGAIGKSEMGADSVGTGETVDGTLKLADMAVFSGTVPAVFPEIPAGECKAVDATAAPVYSTNPLPDLSATPLIVGQPATFPGDTVTLSGRGTATPGVIRLTACNLGTAAVTPNAGQALSIPFLIFT
jgi:hypothetical protein